MRCPLAALLLVLGSACNPVVDDGGNETGAGTEAATTSTSAGDETVETVETAGSGTASASDTGEPVSCEGLDEDQCQGLAHCQTVKGADATPEGGPGEYSCSDISLPFACAPIDCEPVAQLVVICSLDDPGMAMWIIDGECIPPGWQECPDSTCL